MSQYTYPDSGDAITHAYITTAEQQPGYWTQSEQWVLQNVFNQIDLQQQETDSKQHTLLDVGCGQGRLLPDFAPYFTAITAIEPDRERYKDALSLIASHKLTGKVTLHNLSLSEVAQQTRYDVVLSSHIIQHIPTCDLDDHLIRLADLTAPNGLLILHTNHSTRKQEYFLENALTSNTVTEQEVTQERFNTLTQTRGSLPVRVFFAPELIAKIEALGLRLLSFTVFHADTAAQKEYGPQVDQHINTTQELKEQHGRDMSLVFHKAPPMIVRCGSMQFSSIFAVPLFGVDPKTHLKAFLERNPVDKDLSTPPYCYDNYQDNDSICRCFNCVDDFFKTGKKVNYKHRFYLGHVTLSLPSRKEVRLDIILTLFTLRNIGIITFNIPLHEITVDDVIVLKHYFSESPSDTQHPNTPSHRALFTTLPPTIDLESAPQGSLKSTCKKLITSITKQFASVTDFDTLFVRNYKRLEGEEPYIIIDDFSHKHPNIFMQSIVELNQVSGYNGTQSAKAWAMTHALPLYGLITGDEGYHFVPEAVAQNKVTRGWGSRNFMYIFAYGSNVISVNFKHSSIQGRSYIQQQRALNLTAAELNSPATTPHANLRLQFFESAPCVAGLDHGVFKCVEKNNIIYFENAFITKLDNTNELSFNKKRHKILTHIYRTAFVMTEINDLFSLISDESGTAKAIESIRRKTELQSEEKSLKNQSKNNFLIITMTLSTIVLGFFALQDGSFLINGKYEYIRNYLLLNLITLLFILLFIYLYYERFYKILRLISAYGWRYIRKILRTIGSTRG